MICKHILLITFFLHTVKWFQILLFYCCDLPTNINRSDYSFALEKLHPGTARNDKALFRL